jgi:hypothetical protein
MTSRVDKAKSIIYNIIIFSITLMVGLALGEVALRVKNADQKNYNIEMWRYSKLLKKKSTDIELGHEHKLNVEAQLQGVKIRLNNLGMRGENINLDTNAKKIIFLGSSLTLGWGVEEDSTVISFIEKGLGDDAVVINTGIGNYNAHRYVRMFDKKIDTIKPDIVVVHYFVNDAEDLQARDGNFLLRNSQIAVIFYHMIKTMFSKNIGFDGLVQHYKDVYAEESLGHQKMVKAFHLLNELSKEHNFKVIFAMTPDSHSLSPNPFEFVHKEMDELANGYGWAFIDFTEKLQAVPAKELWVMPGDPHYNALGHKIMAQELLPLLIKP